MSPQLLPYKASKMLLYIYTNNTGGHGHLVGFDKVWENQGDGDGEKKKKSILKNLKTDYVIM